MKATPSLLFQLSRTGYDRLPFLFGVIFFLCRLKDIGVYVTLFAIGHSTTLLVGVEIGQLLARSAILIAMSYWRRTESFDRYPYTSNAVLMNAGFMLMGYQFAGYFLTPIG